MGQFNRYTTDTDDLKFALWEGNEMYCNPKNYWVTADECEKYLAEIETGQKLNKELNEKRGNRLRWIAIPLGVILNLSIPPIIYLYLDALDSGWGLPVSIISSWALIGGSIWLYNLIEEHIRNNYIWSNRFFPPVNEKIERLYDDYLWKCYMEREAKSKDSEERERIRKQIRDWSHPNLETFLSVVENELENPSETCVLGDVEFGMTPEEIYKTKTFSGLDRKNQEVYLGYRGDYLGRYFGINGNTYTKFHFENNRLDKVSIISNNGGYRFKHDIIEPFIACCKVLSKIYGTPKNLHKRYMSEKLELWPHDKVLFAVGRKCIQLSVGENSIHYAIIIIEFSQNLQTKQNDSDIDYEFSEEWFDDMRRDYNRPSSVPDYPFDPISI